MGDSTMLEQALTRIENVARRTTDLPPEMSANEIRTRYGDLFCELFTYYTVLFASPTTTIPLVPLRDAKVNPDYEQMTRASRNMIKSSRLLCAVRARVFGKMSPLELRREIAFMQEEINYIRRCFPTPPVAAKPQTAATAKTPRSEEAESETPARKKKKPAEVHVAS